MTDERPVERLVRVWWWTKAGCASERVPVEIVSQVREQLRGEGAVSWVTRCGDREAPEPW